MNDVINKYLSNITKISYINSNVYIETFANNYIVLDKKIDKNKLFDFFRRVDFNFFKYPLNNDSYEIYLLSNDYDVNKVSEIDLNMFIDCLSLLHKKTMEYDAISDDDFNKLYNYLYLKIDDTYKYYLRLQSKIEEKKFPSPGEFLLINNISMIYKLLDYSLYKLDSLNNCDKDFHMCVLINKVSSDNFDGSFIDFNYYSKGISLFDLDLFFKNYYYANLISLFDRYWYNLSVNDCNLSLFLCLISIVWKVDFSSTNFNNCFRVRSLLDYVNKVFNFISEKDKENEKTNENKLEEEDNNI